MESKEIITILFCILGGYALNIFYIQIIKLCFIEWYDNAQKKFGLRGLKLRIAIAILFINTPALISGLISPQPLMSMLCTSSAFFALVLLLRNVPRDSQAQKA